MLSNEIIEKVRAFTHKAHQDDARSFAVNRGMPMSAAATLAAAVKPPLVGYSDGRHVFFGETDAKAVGADAVDTRDWNDVLAKLNEAGHTVVITDGVLPD